eukprot:scaffold17382_cov83-Phaeocystis_antarctica.AAC.1
MSSRRYSARLLTCALLNVHSACTGERASTAMRTLELTGHACASHRAAVVQKRGRRRHHRPLVARLPPAVGGRRELDVVLLMNCCPVVHYLARRRDMYCPLACCPNRELLPPVHSSTPVLEVMCSQ